MREKLEAWRREEQKKEEAEYSRLAHELEEYLLDKRGHMPRFHRKPKDDYEKKRSTLARFVRKYSGSILLWQEEVLKQCPRVRSAFANAALRARMPLPPVGVDISGASEEEMVFPVVAAEDLPNTHGPRLDNMTETDRDAWVKVRRRTDLAELLETAIYRNLENWETRGVSPVGPELLGTVLTPSMVRRAADCGFSRADCRGFIRGFVHLQVDYWPTDAFWLDSGLALEDYASLLRTACSE